MTVRIWSEEIIILNGREFKLFLLGSKNNQRCAVSYALSWVHPCLLLGGRAELLLTFLLPSHMLQPPFIPATFTTLQEHAEL